MNKYIFWLTLFVLFLNSCTHPDLLAPTPLSTPITSQNSEIDSLLFQPSDLDDGWVKNSYEVHVYDDDAFMPEDIFGKTASITAIPLPTQSPRGPEVTTSLFAQQDVLEHLNAIRAEESFQELTNYYRDYKPEDAMGKFNLQIENDLYRCRQGISPPIRRCSMVLQWDKYVIITFMAIDDHYITDSDWEDLVNAVQERLLSVNTNTP